MWDHAYLMGIICVAIGWEIRVKGNKKYRSALLELIGEKELVGMTGFEPATT